MLERFSFDTELRTRLYKTSSIIISLIFLAGGTAYLVTGLSYFFGSILVASSASSLLGLFLFKRGVDIDKVVWIPIVLSYMNDTFGWFYLAGYDGSAPMMFVVLTMLSITLVPRQRIVHLLIGALVLVLSILYVEANYPHLFVPYASPELEKTDLVFILFLGFFSISSIGFYFRTKILSVAKELKDSKDELAERVKREEAKVRELEIAENKLLNANKSLEQFAHITSHDLQEPLVTMNSLAGILKEDYGDKLDDEGKQYLDFLEDSAFRLRSQIRSILDYSKLGTNIKVESFDPKEVVATIEKEIESFLVENNASIEVDSLPQQITSGKTELKLVLQNLFINGVKYNGAEKPKVQVSASEIGGIYTFCVSDNGQGIDERNLESIFTMFRRANSDKDGSGIGLSNARKIVDALGGKIWAESEVGVGSKFFFTIPK